MAKTKKLKKSPFMGKKKAKNHQESVLERARLARKSGSSFSGVGWGGRAPGGIDARVGGDARREWEVALHAAAKAARRQGQLTDLRVCPVAHYDQVRFTAAHAALLALATAVSVCCDPSSPAERPMDPALHEVRASVSVPHSASP